MDNVTLESVSMSDIDDSPSSDVTVTPALHHVPKIFLQTSAAQGIAGVFAFMAMIVTCWQVRNAWILFYDLCAKYILLSYGFQCL